MIQINVNNGRTMDIFQDKDTNSIKVITGTNKKIDSNYNISEGDFVMLLDYYRYIKNNDIQCGFINPNGIREI